MYNPTYWLDEVVEHPYRYKEQQNPDGSIEHTPDPGEVQQPGTPQSAANFNKMENGIFDAHLAADIFLTAYMQERSEYLRRLNEHDAEFSAEVGTVTLTNSNTVFFGFNTSGSTVSLKTVRKTMNYDLDIEVQEYSGGQLGEIEVYDKQLNGFKLRFTGSAKTVKVKYKVRGGMYA